MPTFSDMTGQEDLVEGVVTLPLGTWTKVVGSDPSRWMIAFSIPTSNCSVTTVSGGVGAINQGIFVQPATSPVVLVYRDWGEFVKGEFWAKSTAGGVSLTYWTARLRT